MALVIPGLSASTFLVITGLYDKIIAAVNNLRKKFKESFIFLLPIGIGTGIGVLASAAGVLHLMETFTLQSYAFFIGLVLGSLPNIYKRMKPKIGKHYNFLLLIFGIIVIILMAQITEHDGEIVNIERIETMGNFITIFSAGVISIFLMAIPGTSGSVTLMVLGQFGTVYAAVSNFRIGIILVFALGAVIGVLLAARIIGYFIERYEANIYFLVFGLVLGSVYILYSLGIENGLAGIIPIASALAFALLGIVCTRLIGRGDK